MEAVDTLTLGRVNISIHPVGLWNPTWFRYFVNASDALSQLHAAF